MTLTWRVSVADDHTFIRKEGYLGSHDPIVQSIWGNITLLEAYKSRAAAFRGQSEISLSILKVNVNDAGAFLCRNGRTSCIDERKVIFVWGKWPVLCMHK